MQFRVFIHGSLLGLAAWSLAATAYAQAGASDAGIAAPLLADGGDGLDPPRLVKQVEPQIPAGTVVRPGAFVLLELMVESDGSVTEAAVVDANDPALAAAVAAAAKRFVFAPAQRAGTPVSGRIRYRYEPPASPGAAVPAAEPEITPSPALPPITAPPPATTTPPEADASGDSFAATATTAAPVREVTRRPIEAERVARIAGANNDPLRAVEVLPGVARPPMGDTLVLIRGSGPNDSVVMVESTPVLLLYHLGGLKSFFNPALLDRVDFYPGNFSVRYGRAIGGAIDARVRAPKRDAWHGIADISLLDASLLIEGPIGDDLAIAVAGRRSYIDALLALSPPKGDNPLIAAPVYWDYQALANYRAGADDELYLQTFGSSDSLALLLPDDEDEVLSELRGELSAGTQFHRALVGWKHRYGDGYAHDIKLGVGYLVIDAEVGELVKQRARSPDFNARSDWHLPLASWLSLDTGVDFVGFSGELQYQGPRYRQQEVDPTSDLTPTVTVDRHIDILRPAAYAELTVRPIERLALIPGVRADYFGDIAAFAFDPRFSARYGVTEATTLKAGIGNFSQPPPLGAAVPGLGNEHLDPTRALHVSAGFEQALGSALSADVEGYIKWLSDLVVNTPNGEEPLLVNDGEGRIFGLELSLDLETDAVFASLAYTLSRSERRDAGGRYVLFDYDQPHILTVAAGVTLGKSWQVSSTFRLVSGNPETPVLGALYSSDVDRYLPLYGEPNSTRAELFHRLDVRLEKRVLLSQGSVTFYLDVQNAYNAQHVEATDYGFDYRARQDVHGLPLLPILGVRGEL